MKKIFFTFYFLLSTFYFLDAQYMIYGITLGGGVNSHGTIYTYNPMTHQQTVVFYFNDTDGIPGGRLLYASDSILYGLGGGGTNNMGTLYCFNPRSHVETVLINFDSTNGYAGNGGNELIEGKDGLLYGTMMGGGAYGRGVLFSYDRQTHKDSVRYNFNDSTSEEGPEGACYMELWQDTSTGVLYGVTQFGGYPGGGGVIYGFNPANNQLTRYYVGVANNTDAWELSSGLIMGNNGLLYGMSWRGGSYDSGCIYSFNIHTGILQVVHSFNYVDGAYPNGNELIQLSNGLLYGGVARGADVRGDGVLFSFDAISTIEKTVKNFHDTDGSEPDGRLIQDPDNGLLYGITLYGGDSGHGVLYSYDTGTGIYAKLLDFNGSNGLYPFGLTLVKDTSVHVIKDSNAGVGELRTKSEEVRVYPNPTNGQFTLSLSNVNTACNVEIYNVLGEKVYQSNINSSISEINIGNQPQGVYVYRVISETGSLIGEGKVVIQK